MDPSAGLGSGATYLVGSDTSLVVLRSGDANSIWPAKMVSIAKASAAT